MHTGLLLDWICLANTWHSRPEPNRILPGFAQYDPGCLWKNAIESESEKLVAGWLHSPRNRAWWFLHTGLLLDQMHLAKTWPGHPDQVWVSFAQYGPGLLWKYWNQIRCGKSDLAYTIWPDSGCTLAVMAITGCNQKCVWIGSGMFTGFAQQWLAVKAELQVQYSTGGERVCMWLCSTELGWKGWQLQIWCRASKNLTLNYCSRFTSMHTCARQA